MSSTARLAAYGFGGGIGLLLMGWATQAHLWYGYQRANPHIGDVSTAPGFQMMTAVLFIVGTIIAFVAFSRGLAQVLTTATPP